jgi:hypothetical protein
MSDNPTAFIDYWDAVDDALLKLFGIDSWDAGMDVNLIAAAQEECQTPEECARWFGESRNLNYLPT